MTQTRNRPGEATRAAIKVKGTTTCSQSTHAADIDRAYEAGFMRGWAEHTEYCRRIGDTYEVGFRYGWAAAGRAMNNAIAEATAGIPSTATEVVARLVRDWDRGRDAA